MKIKYYLRGLGTGIVVSAILMALVAGGKKELSDEEIKQRAARLGMVVADNTLAGKTREGEEASTAETQELQEAKESQGDSQEDQASQETQETQESQENQASQETQETLESQENQASREMQETLESQEDQASQETQETLESQEDQASQETKETQESQEDQASQETQEAQESQEDQASQETQEQISQTGSVTIVIRSGYSSNTVAKLLAEAGLVESASKYDAYLCANGYDKRINVGTFEIPFGSSEEEIARIITGRK